MEIIKKLNSLFSQYPSCNYKKGSILIQAGKKPAGIFYIQKGIIRQYWISEKGSEITLNMYKPHAFFPMSWAVASVTNLHFYEALTDVTAKHAPKEKVLAFLKKEPDIVFDLLKRIYIGMEGLWMHIESITSGNSYIKFIASIVILAKRFGKQNGKGLIIDLKMNEQDIANYAGMSRETASRELRILKKENLVEYEKGMITVPNLQKLEEELKL